MRYPLFISDFDGTLVRADGTVSERNIRAIREYRRAGGTFVICTGRMLASILPRLKELGLEDGLVIALQGAIVADVRTGKLIKDGAFSRAGAHDVLTFMEAQGWHIHMYVGDKIYANRRDGLLDAYEAICRVKATVPKKPLSEVAARGMRVRKALAMCLKEERDGIRRTLEARFGEEYFVACSSEWLVEIMPKDQTKAAAVRFLCDYYRLSPSQAAAIGDQENDAPMIAAAGGKFAVENAVPALKEIATVVPSVEEDGVAAALEYAMGERI